MNRRIFVSIIVIFCFLTFVAIFHFCNKEKLYPSVINDSSVIASDIDLFVKLQHADGENQLECVISNYNYFKITYEENYYLEKKIGDEWFELCDISGKRSEERNYNALEYSVSANASSTFLIRLNNFNELSEGTYRLVKRVEVSENDSDTSTSTFIIGLFQIN